VPERAEKPRALVLSRSWWQPEGEASFVLRAVAGALSRWLAVDVVTPGPTGRSIPDGLHDVAMIGGLTCPGTWPDMTTEIASAPRGTTGRSSVNSSGGHHPVLPIAPSTVIAVAEDADWVADALLRQHAPLVPRVVVGPAAATVRAAHQRVVTNPVSLGLHVPVNLLAAERPHNGFGFTDYVLVLSGRRRVRLQGTDEPDPAEGRADIPDLAAWVVARFPREHVLVVEDGVASAWSHRSRLGDIAIETRVDLWRLMAHARATVDLQPGPLFARECVESLRFGTPVVASAHAPGATFPARWGGLRFDNAKGLLACVEALSIPAFRANLARRGRLRADSHHGNAHRFVARVGELLERTMSS